MSGTTFPAARMLVAFHQALLGPFMKWAVMWHKNQKAVFVSVVSISEEAKARGWICPHRLC